MIDAFVDALDLADLGFDGVEPEPTGRPSYHRSTHLKLYIYGYLDRVQSSRRLEREAGRNVEVMWLLRRLTPDHKTIADFRKDNGKALRKVCARFVELCREMGLLAQARVAIDGSKLVLAKPSSAWTRSIIAPSNSNPPQWKERYVILSAVDKAASKECIDATSRPGAPGGPPLPEGAGGSPVQFIGIPPKTVFAVSPGSQITAMTGPPCPVGPPGSMLCPNLKTCHPPGSVCCPASHFGGFCPAGQFCDAFVNACIKAGDKRLCPILAGAFEKGINPHCAPGFQCTGPTCIKSDIRLKQDIVKLGTLDNGIGIYRFRYTWSDQAYVGVMAQEVQMVMPEAVGRGADGCLRVNYDKVGIRFQTWEAWGAATTEDRRSIGGSK